MGGQRLGRLALAATGLAVALMLLTALLGPSAAVVPLPPGHFPLGGHGLFGPARKPSPWLVTGLLAAAVVASVAATWTAWRALGAGWAPSARRLLAGALVAIAALAVVPPVAGADVLSYAAYGHIAARGLDAFTTRPDSLGQDPFARAVENPWRATPSVYGPLAVWEQEAVVRLASGRLRLAVGLLDLVNGVAFAGAGVLLFLLAGDEDRRRRAVLGFALNPILLFVVVAGGHLDALVTLLIVAALALVCRRSLRGAFSAGLVGGAAVLVKLTAGLPLAGWAWFARFPREPLPREPLPRGPRPRGPRPRGRWTTATVLAAGTAITMVAGYAVVGLHALDQARKASSFVSVGTPWRPVRSVLQAIAGHHAASLAISAGSLAVSLWLAFTLSRTLPRADAGDRVVAAAWEGLVPALAWTLAASYVLGWYDAVPWALLALQPLSRYHKILLAHTGILALAYLPGRVVPLPPALNALATVLRSGVSPALLGVLLVLAFRPPAPTQRSRHMAAA